MLPSKLRLGDKPCYFRDRSSVRVISHQASSVQGSFRLTWIEATINMVAGAKQCVQGELKRETQRNVGQAMT
jgi:hypothetical protein